ncbi:MAG: hypothetical protein COB02_03780 [Candidatus Cloacimonadota bacterium]|nr:MAG: hypothetical protein COB02_03780 [Candidatus Cloacimonadota bacterium]
MQGGLHTKQIYKKHSIESPLVTIVTPNYNGAKYLEETILSLQKQNYHNIEHIIIDGKSSDQSLQILQKYQDKIDFFLSEQDQGMYDAINKGFSYANGEIFAYLNSDDLYQSNCIKRVVETYKKLNEDFLVFSNFSIKNETTKKSYHYKASNFGKKSILCYQRMPFAQQSAFWTRKIWDLIGPFDTQYKYVGDFDFFSKILLSSQTNIFHLKENLATFRIHEEALSTHKLMIDEALDVRKKLDLNHISFQLFRRVLSHYYYTISNLSSSLQYRYDKFKLSKGNNYES